MSGYTLLWWCLLTAGNTAVVATILENFCGDGGKPSVFLAFVLYLILILVSIGHQFT